MGRSKRGDATAPDRAKRPRAAVTRGVAFGAVGLLFVSWGWPLLSRTSRPWLARAQVRFIDEQAYDVLPDEYRWLTISDTTARLYLAGKWRDPFWLQSHQDFGVTNPCGGKLWLGWPSLLAGLPPLAFWEYDRALTMDQNLARPDVPDPRRLGLVRWASLLSALLTAVLASLAVWVATGRLWSAPLFLLLAATHAVPLATAWRVNDDWPPQMWTWAAVLALVAGGRSTRPLPLLLAGALAAGLAIGSKFSAAVMLAPLAGFVVGAKVAWRTKLGWSVLAAATLTFAFLLPNPAWQMAPRYAAREVSVWEQRVAARFPPGNPYHLDVGARLRMTVFGPRPGPAEVAAGAAGLLVLLLWLGRRDLRSSGPFSILTISVAATLVTTAAWLPGPVERWMVGSTMGVCALAACLPGVMPAKEGRILR
jgi:hypothetical protein